MTHFKIITFSVFSSKSALLPSLVGSLEALVLLFASSRKVMLSHRCSLRALPGPRLLHKLDSLFWDHPRI